MGGSGGVRCDTASRPIEPLRGPGPPLGPGRRVGSVGASRMSLGGGSAAGSGGAETPPSRAVRAGSTAGHPSVPIDGASGDEPGPGCRGPLLGRGASSSNVRSTRSPTWLASRVSSMREHVLGGRAGADRLERLEVLEQSSSARRRRGRAVKMRSSAWLKPSASRMADCRLPSARRIADCFSPSATLMFDWRAPSDSVMTARRLRSAESIRFMASWTSRGGMISRISTMVTLPPQRSVCSSSLVRSTSLICSRLDSTSSMQDVADDRAQRGGRDALERAREVGHVDDATAAGRRCASRSGSRC